MFDSTIVTLADIHRSKGELTIEDSGKLMCEPIRANRFVDAGRVRTEIFELPNDVRLGRELYVGAIAGCEDEPWQLIIDIDCVEMQESERGILTTNYGLSVRTINRMAYGDFFAGNYGFEDGGDFAKMFTMSELKDSWALSGPSGEIVTVFTQSCALTSIHKKDRQTFKRYGNPIGREYLIRDKGDVPALITGISLDGILEEQKDTPSWKTNILCHYWREGYGLPFVSPITGLAPPPRVVQPSLLQHKVG